MNKQDKQASHNPSAHHQGVESFDEWQEQVLALDNAVRKHLGPNASQNWRRINVPVMLGDWKAQRHCENYLSLVARWLHTLSAFEAVGSLTTRVVLSHLDASIRFLSQGPTPTQAELDLAELARHERCCIARRKKRKRRVA